MDEVAEVVLIGSGHNALVAAARLAEQGRRVIVLEREGQAGGALRSAEITEPGFVHDLFATNLNLFLTNPGFTRWRTRLEAHGFAPVVCDAPYANVFPDGTALAVHRDARRTEAAIAAHDERDLVGWRELHAAFGTFATTLLPLVGPPMPSWSMAGILLRAVRAIGIRRTMQLVRIVTASTRELGDAYFHTREAKALIATWGMHLDFGPDVSFGAMFPFVETFADLENGITIARGGASTLTDALIGVVREFGGDVRVDTEVVRVVTRRGRAVGVELADGRTIGATEAVIAGTGPDALFNDLLAGDPAVDGATRRSARRYAYGPGTMMIHLALDGPVPWEASGIAGSAYVHVAPSVDDLARTYQQAQAGVLPDAPLLVVGQSSIVDPTRAPAGKHVLWIQVRALPARPTSDALGVIEPGAWRDIKDAYADRVLALLEGYAPGLGQLVRSRVVLSPADLEAMNPNLVGGDSVGGSHHVWQNFVFRPWSGRSRYAMAVDGLYLTGAATWPGAGLNGMSGWNVAEVVHRAIRRRERAERVRDAVTSLKRG